MVMIVRMIDIIRGMTKVRVREGIAVVIKIEGITVLLIVCKERRKITDYD